MLLQYTIFVFLTHFHWKKVCKHIWKTSHLGYGVEQSTIAFSNQGDFVQQSGEY